VFEKIWYIFNKSFLSDFILNLLPILFFEGMQQVVELTFCIGKLFIRC
jgi:hypothetical protein